MMKPNNADGEIQQSAERLRKRLAEVPADKWGAWMVGVLKQGEAHAEEMGQREAFDAALHEVQHYLEQRLIERLEIG